MLKYVLKRVLIFIPTILAISLLTFIISINAPGDPVDSMLNKNSSGGEGQVADKLSNEKAYIDLRHKLGLDLPLFYFSITNATASDTLYKVPKASRRVNLDRLSYMYGNWSDVSKYYGQIQKFENALYAMPKTAENVEAINKAKDYINSLYENYDDAKLKTIFSNIDFLFSNTPSFLNIIGPYNAVKNALTDMQLNKSVWKRYIPVIDFFGINNQYHLWMFGDKPWYSSLPWVNDSQIRYRSKGFVRGDFGISYQDKRPVSSVIWSAMEWTMLISSISIILAYLIAIPLGIKSAVSKGSRSEKVITTGLFILYSLPTFWIATILIIFFCGGDWFSWFPSPGAPPIPSDAPILYQFSQMAYRLALPIFCWTYGSLAFISRQMRGGMLSVIGQDYIRTARAKGLSEKVVIRKHALRNSMIPIITLFASVFPAMISGSFVIEYIFSIPGMGKISYDALLARNYPIIFTVMMFTAILTLAGTLLSDILYAVVDPRISFSNKRK
ncbi:MAG: ABC transporter permease subunit [Bacteroidia bacterium]